jgi:hypothetical protein
MPFIHGGSLITLSQSGCLIGVLKLLRLQLYDVWNKGNYLTTQNNIPEDLNLQQQWNDNLKSPILYHQIIIIEVLLLFLWTVEETCLLLDSWHLKMGPIGCPKMSVRNNHHLLHINPDEGSSHVLLGWSPKSHVVQLIYGQDLNRGLPSPLIRCIVFILAFLVSFKELFKFNMPQPAYVCMF